MRPLAKTPTPAALALLKQANRKWPRRSRASDGLLPSKAHQAQNPNSDHNDGYAVDITHDPKHGVNCAKLFQDFQFDFRVEYLIHDGKIWSRGKGVRKYTGPNPHKHHLHVSIRREGRWHLDTRTWFHPY